MRLLPISCLWLGCVLAGSLTPCRAGPPKPAPKPPVKPAASAVDPAVRHAAAQRALGWLEQHVATLADTSGTPTKPFTLAFVGLDLLLDAGDYAPRGARGRLLGTIRRTLGAYLAEVERRVVDPTELPAAYGVADSSKLIQYVWPLALQGWLLSECALRDLDAPTARAELRRIAVLLEAAQHSDDGWGHGLVAPAPAGQPKGGAGGTEGRGGMHLSGYPPTLLAPTNCAATAIAWLDRALERGSSLSARRALRHYQAAILSNGNMPYDVRQRSADRDLTGVGRTAGALVALHSLGASHTDASFQRAASFLREHWDVVGEGHGSPVLNLVFGALAAHVLSAADVLAFEKAWLPAVLARQTADGALDCACQQRLFGSSCDSPGAKGGGIEVFVLGQRAYVTALTTFVLLLERQRPRALGGPAGAPAPVITER